MYKTEDSWLPSHGDLDIEVCKEIQLSKICSPPSAVMTNGTSLLPRGVDGGDCIVKAW